MAIFKRGNVYWYEFVFNGERVRESTKASNRRAAEQIEAAAKTRLAKAEVGIEEKDPAPVFRDFAPRFRDAIKTLCANKPATVSFYESKLAQLLEFESLAAAPLDEIDEEMVERYRQHRSKQISRRKRLLAPASVNRELATLRRLLRLAVEWKVIDKAPRVKLSRGERNREFVLSYEQEPIYLGATAGDLHDVAVVLLDTGLRIGELLRLEWPQVRLEPAAGAKLGYLTVKAKDAKNSRSRNVPLTERARDLLLNRGPRKSGLVFQRADGSPLYQTWVNQQHAAVRGLLNLPTDFVLHSLRHTYGTRLGEAGADAFTIMRLMGHSSVTVSQRYVHPTPETLERAVSRLEKLNRGELREEKVPQVAPKVKTTGKRKIQ